MCLGRLRPQGLWCRGQQEMWPGHGGEEGMGLIMHGPGHHGGSLNFTQATVQSQVKSLKRENGVIQIMF